MTKLPSQVLSALVLLALAAPVRAGELELFGQVSARGIAVEGRDSWLAGGFGRLRVGPTEPEEDTVVGLGEADLGLNWEPARFFATHLHATGRAEPDSEADALGLVEAFVDFKAFPRTADELRFRLGFFILPTSFENIDPLWQSPYTITFSALNSWIGEEIRLTGLLIDYNFLIGSRHWLDFGVSVFGGNDSSGALLAWRGWAMGDRLTGWEESLPLPPLDTLAPGGVFWRQDPAGTTPFTSDLDGEPGWAGFVSWTVDGGPALQVTHYDNRADRALHDGQYAWHTEYDLLGLEIPIGGSFIVLGELMDGTTGMGPTVPKAELDFSAWYVLASWTAGRWRLSGRYDEFDTEDLDGLEIGETSTEDGRAWTAALFFELASRWRFGLEAVDLTADRVAAAESGFDPNTDGRTVTFEVRYSF